VFNLRIGARDSGVRYRHVFPTPRPPQLPIAMITEDFAMSSLSKKDRLKIMEMVAEIASEAAKNPNIVWMIEFQEELVCTLYHTMVALVEHDEDEFPEEDDEDEEG
jgi:hypothetical protein